MHKLLANGKKIKSIEDAYGTPTYAVDLAKRMRELVELDLPCVYHVTNSGEGASYADFARKVCELKGYDAQLLESALADSLKRPAPRPTSSKLACLFSEKFGLSKMQSWEQGLEEFLSSE
jgi:dTDP-4-dehydrorhamnose reductase